MTSDRISSKKIAVLIPCYNEVEGIGTVIKSFPKKELRELGYDCEVIVIDNNSSDGTADVARSHGATVLHEPKRGKGNAMRRGFQNIPADANYVVMLDGDNTYRPEEVFRLVEPLVAGAATVAIGSRLEGTILDGSMAPLNRFGNWLYSRLVCAFYRAHVTDVLTGYFAWTRDALTRLQPHVKSEGFAIEIEMVTKMARLQEKIVCVPISYHPRLGETKLNPIYDGARILRMFLRNLWWQPPAQTLATASPAKKKIAIVSDAVYPFNKGGKEKRIHNIATYLAARGYEITIYCMKWWEGGKVTVRDGITFHAISPLYPLYSGGRRSIKEAVLFALHCLKLLGQQFDAVDVDHMPHLVLFTMKAVCLLKRKKMFATWHEVWGKDYWRHYLGMALGTVAYKIEKASAALPDTIISVSEHTTHALRTVLETNAKIVTFPNGLDLQMIKSVAPSYRSSDAVFAGRLLANKNVGALIRAVHILQKKIPSVSLVIVGEGPERASLQKLADDLGLRGNISFLDFLEDDRDLYGVMRSSRVFVLPSTREGFGIAVIEANACGLPAVTIDDEHNAARKLIQNHENGLVCPLDEQKLADAIETLLEVRKDPDFYAQYAEQYSWDNILPKLETLYTA